LSEGKESTS